MTVMMREANELWILPEHYVGDELMKAIEADFMHVQKLAGTFQITKRNKNTKCYEESTV